MFTVIGSTTVDFFIKADLPQAGADGFRADNLVFHPEPLLALPGGNGGCCVYALASLGLPVALCSAVGRDALGDMVAGWLAERGVTLTAFARLDSHATSTSTVIVHEAEQQTVLHHLGATAAIRPALLPASLLAQTRVLLATSYPHTPQMRAGGFLEIFRVAKNNNTLIALDIGPAIGEPVSLAELRPLLPWVDYLIGNTHELSVAAGADDWQAAAAALLEAGAGRVVIKQGAAGSALVTATERVTVPGFPVAAHVTAGAGDSFDGGFLYGLSRGWTAAQALQFGNAVAALMVSGQRGIVGAPDMATVEAFLNDAT